MERRVTEADLANFAAVGFPGQVRPATAVGDADLMRSVLRVVEAPSSRLVEAASLALVELAVRGQLQVVREFELSEPVARRLGYVAERLATHLNNEELRDFASFLTEYLTNTGGALLLTDAATKTYQRQLMERADEVNQRWGVYGDLELRFLPV